MVTGANQNKGRLEGGYSKMGALILLNQPRCLPVSGFVLDDGSFAVGRSTHCDFVLPHSTVSRRHAELRVAAMQVEVVDLGSRNGTFVNGTRIEAAMLRLLDVLQLGKVSFVLADRTNEDDCGSYFETASTRETRPSPLAASAIALLSAAQRRVLDLVLEGLVEKQIATRLKISRHTAHNHVRNIYRNLGVHSRAELLARFIWKSEADRPTGIHFGLPKSVDLLS